jgi:peptide/nickel transport system permease protein
MLEKAVQRTRKNFEIADEVQIPQIIQRIMQERLAAIAGLILLGVLILGLFGDMLAPYDYQRQFLDSSGQLKALQPPSGDHWLGTTSDGRDVLSRVLIGAQPTAITGLLGGGLIVMIGLTIGVISGYLGGTIGAVLMRITDFVYGVPLIPFALVIAAVVGIGFWSVIFIIGALLWRSSARVIRSQVLQIRERPFIKSAEALGASRTRIIRKHILPNVMGMAALYFALGIGYSIIFQASLAFIGVSNPFVPSWGVMVRNVYNEFVLVEAWWWSVPPTLLISATVVSTFVIGRAFEDDDNALASQ